jgi:hypothetical protein
MNGKPTFSSFNHTDLLLLMNPNIRCVLSESNFDETYISPWRTDIVAHVPLLDFPGRLQEYELTISCRRDFYSVI